LICAAFEIFQIFRRASLTATEWPYWESAITIKNFMLTILL